MCQVLPTVHAVVKGIISNILERFVRSLKFVLGLTYFLSLQQ